MDITLDLRRRSGARGEQKLPVNTVKRPPPLHFLDGCPAPRGPPYASWARRPSRLTGLPPHNSWPSPPGPRPHPTPPPGPRPLLLPHAPAVGTAPARPSAGRGEPARRKGRGGAGLYFRGRGWVSRGRGLRAASGVRRGSRLGPPGSPRRRRGRPLEDLGRGKEEETIIELDDVGGAGSVWTSRRRQNGFRGWFSP